MAELNPKVVELCIKGIKHIQDNVYKFNNTLYVLYDSKKLSTRLQEFTFKEYSKSYVIIKCVGGKHACSPIKYDGFNRCKVTLDTEARKGIESLLNEYYYEVGRKVRRAKEMQSRKKVKCPVCGKKFTPKNGKIYCSHECTVIAMNEKAKIRRNVQEYKRVCPICGKEFTTTRESQIYCGAKCRIKRNNDYLIKKHQSETYTKKACKHCGKEFIGSPREVYCSATCRIRHNVDMRKERKINLVNIEML